MENLINRRIELKALIKNAEEELKKIDEEIWMECEVGEVLLGSDGYGYRLKVVESFEYGQSAIDNLKAMGLIDHFIKISTAGLEKLRKAKLITSVHMDALMETATLKETKRIEQFIPEEAKII